MSETFQRLLALEAHVQVLTKRLEETAAAIPAGVGPGMQVPDYSNYKGPFMVGLLADGYVKVGAGYILAPGGAYAYGGGTSGGLAAGTNYVVLKIDMDDDEVDAVTVQIKAALSDITSTTTTKLVLIAVVKCEGGKAIGRVQEQRGNIVLNVDPDHGTSTLGGASDSTLNPSSMEKLDFAGATNSNTDTLEADATDDDITIKKAGWYTVTVSGRMHVHFEPAGTAAWVAALFQIYNGGIYTTREVIRLATDNIGVATSYTGGDITVTLCQSFDCELTAGNVLTMHVLGSTGSADIDRAELNVRYLHP